MAKTRIYRVQIAVVATEGNIAEREYLVDATSRNQAERHVAAKFVSAEIADGKTIAAMMKNGASVEQARPDVDTETADLPGVP